MKSLIQNAVASAFGQMGDLVSSCIYGSTGAYDPATGGTAAGSTYNIAAVITGYASREIDGTIILAKDKKAIIALQGLTPTIETNGTITHDGVKYNIQHIRQDPAGASLTVQLRV